MARPAQARKDIPDQSHLVRHREQGNARGSEPDLRGICSLIGALLQSSLVELDEVEVSPDVFSAGAAGFFEEMNEARFLGGGIGMPRDHRLVPMLDFLRRMLGAVFVHPIENGGVVVQLIGYVFERVALDAQKCEQMFVEPNGLVIVSVK